MEAFFIVIHGPTGVGKTDFILSLGKQFPIEIINCDIGQMYEPISIGTAKPDWKNETIPHHLFDNMTIPENYSVVRYREEVQKKIQEISDRGAIPVLVGGSGFYGKSLFFPPIEDNGVDQEVKGTWEDLEKIDPERAHTIHKNDMYRINRALSVIASSGLRASAASPTYNPLGRNFLMIYLYRDRQLLYENINKRTEIMMQQGWIDEVKRLQGTHWEPFLKVKKLIGYPEIFEYLEGNCDKEILISTIAKKTRNYAKRQETFWRMFKVKLLHYITHDHIVECDLSDKKSVAHVYTILTQKIKGNDNMDKTSCK